MTSWRDAAGIRHRRAVTTNSESSAIAALARIRQEAGIIPKANPSGTISDLLESWMEAEGTVDKAANTVESYRRHIEKHIKPRIGGALLRLVSVETASGFFTELVRDKVGDRTRELCYIALNAAMDFGARTGRLPENFCAAVPRPKYEPGEIIPFSLEESKRIIEATRGEHYHAATMLGLCCGMRGQEIFGIGWKNIDFKGMKIRIDVALEEISGRLQLKKPKTKASNRTILMPEAVAVALEEHRKRMVKAGFAKSPVACPSPEGVLTRKGVFRKFFWNRILKSLDLDLRGFHHTRHTFATLSLGAFVPIHVVSKILGHSKVSTTLDMYAHYIPEQHADARLAVNNLFATPSGYSQATPENRKSS